MSILGRCDRLTQTRGAKAGPVRAPLPSSITYRRDSARGYAWQLVPAAFA